MRGRIFLTALLGFSLLALPAYGYRFAREKPGHENPGKPDRPGMERARPGDDGAQITRSRDTRDASSPGRMHQGRTSTRTGGVSIGKPGQVSNGSSRMSCNEADECSMSAGGTKTAISRAAQSRAPGNGAFGKVNNAKGKSMVGNRTKSMRSQCNEADECTLGKAGAQAVIFKAAHSRGTGGGNGGFGKINNARGQNMLGRAMPSSRMACNEAEECSMGNSGAKAEWQKAEQRSRHR